jgi:F0F1-type ATP synthase membrane subunit b/b'
MFFVRRFSTKLHTMDLSSPNHPAHPVYQSLESHVKSIRTLLNELEPAERLRYLNEMMVRLLTSKGNAPKSTKENLERKFVKSSTTLSSEEKSLIEKLSKDTEELYRGLNEDTTS